MFGKIVIFVLLVPVLAMAADPGSDATFCSTGFGNNSFNGTWIASGTYLGWTRYYNVTTASSAAQYLANVEDGGAHDYYIMDPVPSESTASYVVGPYASVQPTSVPWGVDGHGTAPAGIVATGTCAGYGQSTSTCYGNCIMSTLTDSAIGDVFQLLFILIIVFGFFGVIYLVKKF